MNKKYIRTRMTDDINTRVCLEDDIERITQIENLCFEYPYPKHIFEDYLGSELFLVAEIEDKIEGYIIAEAREDEGIIISIAVDPSCQRRGIGGKMMENMIDRLSVDHIFLTVRVNNKAAQKFYEHLGFKDMYVIKKYYSNDEDAVVMGKKLQKNE